VPASSNSEVMSPSRVVMSCLSLAIRRRATAVPTVRRLHCTAVYVAQLYGAGATGPAIAG